MSRSVGSAEELQIKVLLHLVIFECRAIPHFMYHPGASTPTEGAAPIANKVILKLLRSRPEPKGLSSKQTIPLGTGDSAEGCIIAGFVKALKLPKGRAVVAKEVKMGLSTNEVQALLQRLDRNVLEVEGEVGPGVDMESLINVGPVLSK